MTTNEPNLAAEIARLQELSISNDSKGIDFTDMDFHAAVYVITRLSEALAVARSGLEFYSDGLHYNHVNDDETFLLDYGAKAEKTIAQIDKITGVKAESQGSEGGNE